MTPPHQSSTDGLHTTSPTATSSTMHIYRSQIDPPILSHEVTTTPTATSHTMYIYRSQMDPPSTVT